MIGPRLINKPLVLYGYGKLGHLAEEIFKELGIAHTIIERKDIIDWPEKYAKREFIGLPWDSNLVAVCIAKYPFHPIKEFLKSCGYGEENIVPVWDIIEAYPEVGIHNGWFAGTVYLEDSDGMKFVLMKLDGDISISHYRAFCGWRRFHEEWPIEIERIDSLPSTLADIRQRQYPVHFTEDYLHEFGKADIHCEGYELKTVEDNIFRFQKYRPRLQVACYHSRDGLWKIEKFLMDNLPDYRWTFRLHSYMGQGAYITGTPWVGAAHLNNERRDYETV